MGLICPELDLGGWSEKLLEQLHGRRYPLDGTMELTERCNLACVHCYINRPAADRAVRARELTTAQVKDILDQMAAAGCLFLTLTGGEVLLRSDFPEIFRYARQRGILISLFTNGTLLTPRIADLLADWRPRSIEITLYGATPETYERVTGVPGSYARCRRGIELLLERRLPLSLKSVALKTNYLEMNAMHNMAEQLGLKFRFDTMLWPRFDGSRAPWEYQLPLETVLALDNQDPERQREWDIQSRLTAGTLPRKEYVYACGAGLRTFHIDSYGRMSICTMSRQPAYDLLRMDFLQVWEHLGDLRKARRQLDTDCVNCTVAGLCVQCPGWSQAVHGDNETPVEFVCALGRLRMEHTQHTSLTSEEIKTYEQEAV